MLIMQAIVETLFDTVYLFSVITIGILMIRKSKGNRQFTMFGIMAVLLGSGDAFHLVPRAVALCTTGLENFTVQLGLGKWITSITMTIFYVVLYARYYIEPTSISAAFFLDCSNNTHYMCSIISMYPGPMEGSILLSIDNPCSYGSIPCVIRCNRNI